MSEYFHRENWVDSYIAATRDLLLKPGEFFSSLPETDHYANSMLFLVITVSVPTLIIALGTFGASLLVAPLVWLMVLGGAWLWAWYMQWAVRVCCKIKLSTVQAFHICSYANMPLLLVWVPLLNAVTGIWSLALMWMGLTRSVGVSSGKALAILLVPFLLIMISGSILIALLMTYAAQNGITVPEVL